MGQEGFARQEAEKKSQVFRRSVYFVKDLKAGERVSQQDIRRIRPGYGLAPKYYSELIGRRLKVNVERGTATSWEQFE